MMSLRLQSLTFTQLYVVDGVQLFFVKIWSNYFEYIHLCWSSILWALRRLLLSNLINLIQESLLVYKSTRRVKVLLVERIVIHFLFQNILLRATATCLNIVIHIRWRIWSPVRGRSTGYTWRVHATMPNVFAHLVMPAAQFLILSHLGSIGLLSQFFILLLLKFNR